MVKVQDIAEWFLSKKPMTNKKLQKICYYAQAWYYTLFNEKLFDAEIQAWVHGPVIPELYAKYSHNGWAEIKYNDNFVIKFPENVISVLEAVMNTYGDFDGNQLESLTHSEEPWINARKGLNPWQPSNRIITCEAMRTYYLVQYEQSQND